VRIFLSVKKTLLTRDIINITYEVTDEVIVIFELYNVLGKKELTKQLNSSSQHQITLSEAQPGIYFYRLLKGDEAVESGKLIVE
jgi:hypothetical protein